MLFVQADVVKTQESVNALMDLALGLCLLVLGALAGTPGRARSSGSSRWSRATTGRVACGRRAHVGLIQFSEVDAVQPLLIVSSVANGVID